jgi:DNA-binding NarL/FixJ family response regulator
MSSHEEVSGGDAPAGPLAAVAEAAGARLRAQTDEDADATRTASESLMAAATSAMAAGHSLRDITAAESRGQDDVRGELRSDALKRVDRAARQARDAEVARDGAVGRAMRLGLSTREVAKAAQVTHGTIRAITNRLAPEGPPSGGD